MKLQEMSKRNIRVDISYDGSGFCGWQIQKNDRTVQGDVEKALENMHGFRVPVTAAGRTDSGVHALGQVINFRTELESIPADRWALALNSYLPGDVQALSSREVPEYFHARYDARSRTYRYYISQGPVPIPVYRNYALFVRKTLDVHRLNEYARSIIGEHDFTTFSVPRDSSHTRMRKISSAAFFMDGPFIVFHIEGTAFLWRMVRSIVGTILELEKNGKGPEDFRGILKAGNRGCAGATAPAWGLYLYKVRYDR